jgi:hypothetical protein
VNEIIIKFSKLELQQHSKLKYREENKERQKPVKNLKLLLQRLITALCVCMHIDFTYMILEHTRIFKSPRVQ